MTRVSPLLLTCLLACGVNALAQNLTESAFYNVNQSSSEIVLDGRLDEAAWQDAPQGGDFTQNFPADNTPALSATEFKITYDNHFIYVGIVCYQQSNGKPIAQSLRRDFSWMQNDNVSLYFDPFNDKTNGFTFQVTPYNVQREGLVTLGGEVSDDWDNKWYSAATIENDKWTAEMAIPFKSIRYNSVPSWGLQVLRNNRQENERSSWISVPQQYRPSDLLYTGRMVWDNPPPKAGTNISFIPYVIGGGSKDYEEGTPVDETGDVGFDAKVGLTNSLNLDITVNPDFSQVEVDRQVTNLQRFEIFFPERRQFFLENQDLFARNGFPPARPFFSRRIGIASDEDGNTVQVPIQVGTRLSGKIGRDWRVGLLNMQTGADDRIGQPGQNYSVAVFQRQIFGRSNIGATFVNRQATNFDPNDTTLNTTRYNRVFGIDYNLASLDNKWEGNFFYHRSDDPGEENGAWAHGSFLGYNTRNVSLFWFHALIGEDYNAEVGFVPRNEVFRMGGGGGYTFWPGGNVQQHGPGINITRVTDDNFNNLDLEASLDYEVNFLNNAGLEFGTSYNEVLLQSGFDPSNSGGAELPADEVYRWSNVSVAYGSDNRKLFNFEGEVTYGGFFNGNRLQLASTLNFRYQPFLALEMQVEYNRLDFPRPYNSTDFFLISPRMDLTLSTKLFLTTFVQYNNQRDNMNINTRLQWRFAPVSDLFIVYTDNYFTAGDDFETPVQNRFTLTPRNRALIVKLSYWLNI